MSNAPDTRNPVLYGTQRPSYGIQRQAASEDDIALSPASVVLELQGNTAKQVRLPPLIATPLGTTFTLVRNQPGDPVPLNLGPLGSGPYGIVTITPDAADPLSIQRAYTTVRWFDTQCFIIVRDALGWRIVSHAVRSAGTGNGVCVDVCRSRSYTTTYLANIGSPFVETVAVPGTPVVMQDPALQATANMARELGSFDVDTGIFTTSDIGAGAYLITVAAQMSQDNGDLAYLLIQQDGGGSIYEDVPFGSAGVANSDQVVGVNLRQAFSLDAGSQINFALDAQTGGTDITVWSFNATIEALY